MTPTARTLKEARALGLVLAIDPGPIESAWLLYEPEAKTIVGFCKEQNYDLLGRIGNEWRGLAMSMVVEQVANYGMPVGAEVFETVFWSGRFIEANGGGDRVPRMAVRMHVCQSPRANDSTIRQALIDRWGGKSAIGTKKAPGPLYGISGDVWQALALAVAYSDSFSREEVT